MVTTNFPVALADFRRHLIIGTCVARSLVGKHLTGKHGVLATSSCGTFLTGFNPCWRWMEILSGFGPIHHSCMYRRTALEGMDEMV